MVVPQRRTSKTAKRLRRSHFKLTAPGISTCPHCGAMVRPHRVCPKCGYYKGKEIVHIEQEEEEE